MHMPNDKAENQQPAPQSNPYSNAILISGYRDLRSNLQKVRDNHQRMIALLDEITQDKENKPNYSPQP